jgi:hypothetical protein
MAKANAPQAAPMMLPRPPSTEAMNPFTTNWPIWG